MLSKFQIFKIGFFDLAPHLLSVIPFGIIFGAIGIELGFDPIMIYATSLIIFGGASQIVFLQLLSGGASSIIAITSVGVINSRHLLYGAVLSEYLNKLPLIKKLFISYFIVDQAFAVSNIYFKKNSKQKFNYYHLLGSGIILWICWQFATILGIFLGSIVPEELGLEFAIPLTFIAIIINELRKLDHLMVMIVSGLAATFFYNAPFKSYILISPLIGLITAYLILKFKK
tara:strand:+ start:78 stop:764 length:687 start_codon:yes stop_codon:yes gene_type:complete